MTQDGDSSPTGLAAGIKGDASAKIFVGTILFLIIIQFKNEKIEMIWHDLTAFLILYRWKFRRPQTMHDLGMLERAFLQVRRSVRRWGHDEKGWLGRHEEKS